MRVFLTCLLTLAFVSLHTGVCAQSKGETDPGYYISFPKTILFRVYGLQKYSFFRIASQGNILRYRSNTPLAAGIGVSYNNLSVNLAYALNFMTNPDKGKTKRIDLQSHLYARRWIYDFYAQRYKGYFIASQPAFPRSEGYYKRPDIRSLHFGFAQYRVFNSTRFSYRAAFLQTERQQRSAGTLLAGAEIHYRIIQGDSSLIPFSVKQDYLPQNLSKVNVVTLSPGAGYAYTLVIKKYVFMTAAATFNLNINYTNEQQPGNDHSGISASPVLNLRTAAGYNGDRWIVSANWIATNLPFSRNNTANRYLPGTGNYRFTFARRFKTGKKLQKRLKVIDKLYKEGISRAKELPLVPG